MSHARSASLPLSVCPIKVLIVEDEYILAADLKETLNTLGYTVTGIAASAIETLIQVEQSRPDVVLMDIRLQGSLDGIETATVLWKLFQVPVVYVTAHSDPITLERVEASLHFGCLIKPVQKTEVGTAIDVAYQRTQS